MNSLSSEAYVLFSRPQGETSLWLSLLTRDHGRVSLVYKGGRKLLSGCRSFQPYHLLWTMNRQQDGGWCRQLEATQTCPLLLGIQNWTGLYVNELLYRLLPPHQPYPSLFDHYHHFIAQLGKVDAQQIAWLVRRVEWQLLVALGYAIPTWQADGRPLIEEQSYLWQDETGWQENANGILGQEIHQLADPQAQYAPSRANRQAILRQFLQHRLSLISPSLSFSMHQWWLSMKEDAEQKIMPSSARACLATQQNTDIITQTQL